MIPLLDLIELAVQVSALILTFTLQTTWMAHYSLFLVINSLASFLKLVGSLTIFCTGIPNRDGQISTWQYKLYLTFRTTALLIFLVAWSCSYILSTVAIMLEYDDPQWGLCSFCYQATCETQFMQYVSSIESAASASGLPLDLRFSVTYSQFFHRRVTSQECAIFNTMIYAVLFSAYFWQQVHFCLTLWQCLLDTQEYNQK